MATPLHRPALIRLAVVAPLYHPSLGGLGRQAQQLTERLRAEGVDLFVISRRMTDAGPARLSPDVCVYRVWAPFPRKHILEHLTFKNIVISACFCAGCLALLWRYRRRYDVVHFHGASLPLFSCLPFLHVLGKRVVAKVASANLGTEAGSLAGRFGPLGRLLRALARRVDAYVAISEEIQRGLLRDGIAPERIHRISNFVDPMLFRPPVAGEKERLKESLGHGGQTLVVFAGRLAEPKGLPCLLEAWREVVGRHAGARLLLLGEGPLRPRLEEIVQESGLSGSVVFGDRVSDVAMVLRAADVFVLPSVREGMPNALLEAMASGLACVATTVGGIPDVLRDTGAGLLVKPSDPRGLAEALESVLSDRGLREDLGRRALGRILSAYSLESRVATYLEVYENRNQAGLGDRVI